MIIRLNTSGRFDMSFCTKSTVSRRTDIVFVWKNVKNIVRDVNEANIYLKSSTKITFPSYEMLMHALFSASAHIDKASYDIAEKDFGREITDTKNGNFIGVYNKFPLLTRT